MKKAADASMRTGGLRDVWLPSAIEVRTTEGLIPATREGPPPVGLPARDGTREQAAIGGEVPADLVDCHVMSDRKYRQQGYQDSGSNQDSRRGTGQTPRRPQTYGPRSINLPPSRTVARCAACGVVLPMTNGGPETCSGCGADLHSCRQCAHFDPGSRFECAKPVPEAISDKSARNQCDLFKLKTTVERDVSSVAKTTDSARSAFDSLFKK